MWIAVSFIVLAGVIWVMMGTWLWIKLLRISPAPGQRQTTEQPVSSLIEENLVSGLPNAAITAEPGVDLAVAAKSKQFQDWLASVDRERFNLKGIHFQSADVFPNGKVGFIKFKADVVDAATGKFLPGIIFARGGSVAVLAVLHCEGKEYAVVAVQPRLATGSFQFEEICAGMLDGDGNFAGVAAKEMREELGVDIRPEDLHDLSGLAGFERGAFPSPGACEETIRIFVWRRAVDRQQLDSMNGRCTGVLEEGENIKLKIVELDHLLRIADMKTIVAYALYKRFAQQIADLEQRLDQASGCNKGD